MSLKETSQLLWNYDPARIGMCWDLNRADFDKRDICQVRFCRTPKRLELRKGKLIRHSICTKCSTRRWRINNPEKRVLAQIRESAKKRHIEFDIKVDDLQCLSFWSDYLSQVTQPNTPQRLTIDRKDHRLGYVKGNLQIIPHTQNVSKGNKERHQKTDDPF